MAPEAALKRGLRNRLMSSIGCSVWRSHRAKAVSRIAAAANPPTTFGRVQPSGPSMMP
jgi:hypothetical protein